ncbi:MAG: hypothetical protein K0S33_1490 [Bacteroidetes bacterium]|jgi:hypothetical protein|nr:hypothetical protein [Bacteroidota bacterium]
MKKLFLLSILCIAGPFVSMAQEEEEDPKKMIREVISVEMEKPKAVKPPPVAVEEPKGKKGKKKPAEEPPPVEEEVDTTSITMIPATPAELSKRANSWYNAKTKKYKKDQGATSGNKMTCVVLFDYKPKELNPVNDVEGTISMNLTIDFKEGRYRYTIDKMEHKAKRGVSSGGDVFNDVPACGSMNLNSVIWKQIRSAALTQGKLLADDLKVKMGVPVVEKGKDEW